MNHSPHASTPAFDASFMRIMAEWEKPMFDFAWQYLRDTRLAGDLVAITFVRFYHQCPHLGKTASPAPGLFGMLAAQCQRQAGRATRIVETDPDLTALTDAIVALPHGIKATWLMRQCTLLSNEEIGDALALRDDQVALRLQRARQLILAHLHNEAQPACESVSPLSIPA